MPTTDCPCGRVSYATCCGPLHSGAREAETAEDLMRARFSGYALGALDYVFRTWHPRTRPADVEPTTLRWTRLEILETLDGQASDAFGTVEFIAHYTDRGRPGRLHERSGFERRRGRWFYLNAVSEK